MKDFELFSIGIACMSFGLSGMLTVWLSRCHSKIDECTIAWMKDQEEINRLLRKRIELLEQFVTDVATGGKK